MRTAGSGPSADRGGRWHRVPRGRSRAARGSPRSDSRPNDVGLQLLENSFATGAALVALILAFGSVSGAHFNPVVTLADRLLGGMASGEAGVYVVAQVVGACVGAIVANLMFELPAIECVHAPRELAGGLWFGEVVATFGLVLVILGVVRSTSAASRAALAASRSAATSPLPTGSRRRQRSPTRPSLSAAPSPTRFAGIQPTSLPAFVAAQLAGGARRRRPRPVPLARPSRNRLSSSRTNQSAPDDHRRHEGRPAMPDLQELSPEVNLAIEIAARKLRRGVRGNVLGSRRSSSSSQPATTSSPTAPRSPTSSR